MSNRVDISEFTRRLDSVLETYRRLPTEIAVIAVNFSKERFRDQAWLDETKHKWKPRKNKRPGRRSQTLLVDTGRLKRSIRKIKATPEQVIIGTDVPYAEIHNEGGEINKTVNVKSHAIKSHRRKAYTRNRSGRAERIKAQTIKAHTVKAHARKMNLKIPSRRFMGNSYTLARRIELHVTARFIRALK
jgi:phage gpG-like protein